MAQREWTQEIQDRVALALERVQKARGWEATHRMDVEEMEEEVAGLERALASMLRAGTHCTGEVDMDRHTLAQLFLEEALEDRSRAQALRYLHRMYMDSGDRLTSARRRVEEEVERRVALRDALEALESGAAVAGRVEEVSHV